MWTPRGAIRIAESVCDRKPVPRKRGSAVGNFVDPFRRRMVWYESRLERSHLLLLVANPLVAEVREQQRVEFRRDGSIAVHFMDIVVIWKSGLTSAYSVKYFRDLTEDHRCEIRSIKVHNGDAFAHQYGFLKETDVGEINLANAEEILWCASHFDFEGRERLIHKLRSADDYVSLAQCDAWLGEGDRGSIAAKSLIQTGLLEMQPRQLLCPGSVLRNRFTN